ncbi:hypothetical protein PC116_g25431 [Phytophthora cactorum]|nr:hypothetical protein PC116_g25431 [Phytophthora cactorum]
MLSNGARSKCLMRRHVGSDEGVTTSDGAIDASR